LPADLEQIDLGRRGDARAARLSREQSHLTEDRVLAELGQLGLAAQAIGREHAQP
jgi:hypothetical protein